MMDKDLPVSPFPLQHMQGVPSFNPAKYLDHVADLDLTEEQKIEFLRTLWSIMAAFVELGFGVDSVMPSLMKKAFDRAGNELEANIPTHEFNAAADTGQTEKE